MRQHAGNLSVIERGMSSLLGVSLMTLAWRHGNPAVRLLSGLAGSALLARSYAGHCGVKAAVMGQGSLKEGRSDQWNRMVPGGGPARDAAAGARTHSSSSAALDSTVNDSFPASDPPASRLPDEPPVNAEAKWAAANAAKAR
jgi:Protein of unknown function (DUF2892)